MDYYLKRPMVDIFSDEIHNSVANRDSDHLWLKIMNLIIKSPFLRISILGSLFNVYVVVFF